MPYASFPIHFSDEMLPAAVNGWFDAMAALHRMAPWSEGPHVPYPLFVTLGSQDMLDAVLHPFERDGGHHGFALLQGPDDLEAWLALEAADGVAEDSPGFPRLELTFGPRADAHPAVRLELERHDRGLDEEAVPSVWTYDDTGSSRPGDVDDLIIAEAVGAAVVGAFAPSGTEAAPDVGRADEPVTRTVSAGSVDVEIELSTHAISPEAALPPAALLDALRELGDDGWSAESRERYTIEHRLGRRFARSPEAAGLKGGSWYWRTLAQWAASHVGDTVATLDADGLEQVVFDIVPRKVSADVDYARPFIECLRAFYRWLGREYALPQASACLTHLDAPDAVTRLERLMGDSANFDPAKAMVMEARAMGIDPSTPEGAMQMQAAMDGRFARASHVGIDSFEDAPRGGPTLDPAVRRKRDAKRKASRKAVRKARKKNR